MNGALGLILMVKLAIIVVRVALLFSDDTDYEQIAYGEPVNAGHPWDPDQ